MRTVAVRQWWEGRRGARVCVGSGGGGGLLGVLEGRAALWGKIK